MPVDLIYREKVLHDLGETIERRLTEAFGERAQFTLLMAAGDTMSHISNTPAPERIEHARQAIQRWSN